MQMPSLEIINRELTGAGFEIAEKEMYFISEDLQDHFLYSGKHDPELYFNTGIRSGISSFSALANLDEVKRGLLELRQDIDNGQFPEIKADYENEEGDYLFITAKKTILIV